VHQADSFYAAKDVFKAVQAGQARYGVVPFENSSFGPVKFTLDELADRQDVYEGLNICGEIYLEVHHFLLGRKDPSSGALSHEDARQKPLTSLSHIRRVYSHQQALGQTKLFRDAYLPASADVTTEAVSSTSRAAEMAAADETGTSAAVASEMAGEVNGLDVLARCIEDLQDNTTWFLVLRKGTDSGDDALPPGLVSAPQGQGYGTEDEATARKYKTLVSFTVPHLEAGALASVLACFQKVGLNLTNINRLPSLARPFQSLFFVEFEGSRLDDPEGRVNRVLEDLDRAAQSWRWWGSWVNQRP
jgi:prephenate dehydratase